MIRNRLIAAAIATPMAAIGLMVPALPASAATATRYVATTGIDTGFCLRPAHPCKTISYAEMQAVAGDTVNVAAGTYNETVKITKTVTISGAGPGKTTINGSGIDYTTRGYYGLVDVADEPGAPAGAITIANMTVNNAYITATEATNNGQSPIDIDNQDSNTSQHVVVTNALVGGTAVEPTLGGVGYYSLSALTPANVNRSTFQNLNQAVLFEGAGAPLTVTQNTFHHLANLTQQGTTYAPQGVFQLSDEEGTNTLNVTSNTFTGYAGYGVASDAGYTQGNCTPSTGNTCTGTADLQVTGNSFALGGATGAAGIYLHVLPGNGDDMNATVTGNTGTVDKPGSAIKVVSGGGGTLTYTAYGNAIANP